MIGVIISYLFLPLTHSLSPSLSLQTLASLSLVFALHHYRANPLYFLDEIDAALDYENVSIIAHYIRSQTKNAQFVVVSLRNHMFETAHKLIGITKENNCTSTISFVPPKEAQGEDDAFDEGLEEMEGGRVRPQPLGAAGQTRPEGRRRGGATRSRKGKQSTAVSVEE